LEIPAGMKRLGSCWLVQVVMMLTTLTTLTTRTTSFIHRVRCTSRSIPSLAAASEESPLSPPAAQSLLLSALSRAKRTLAEKQHDFPLEPPEETGRNMKIISELLSSMDMNANTSRSSLQVPVQEQETQKRRQIMTQELLSSTIDRSKRTFSAASSPDTCTGNKKEESKADAFIPTDLRYNQNPAISLTALAHWLWSSVLRPHQDVAIDATCGNGNDAVGMASILFGNEHLYLDQQAQLICIDVQEQACQATQQALSQMLSTSTMTRHVQILHASHAPLQVPILPTEPGLVVYNLGYLPNQNKEQQTRVESTLQSITDALLLIRIGGMVSIMTYPGSNREEDMAVRILLLAAVAMTNRQGPSWQEVVANHDDHYVNQPPVQVPTDENDPATKSSTVKALLVQQLSRMSSAYQSQAIPRTFRVTEHKKIGLENAPILMTATRIK
jgi:Putative rRNA methylase